MPSKSELIAQSIAVLALRSHLNRHADRKLVESGKTYDGVSLKVVGTVAKKPVKFELEGSLKVGDDNPTGSTKKPAADVLAARLLDLLPKTRLKKLQAEIESGKALPEPSLDSLALSRAIIDRLSTKGPRAGSVSFVAAD